jgi:hypothetical protein
MTAATGAVDLCLIRAERILSRVYSFSVEEFGYARTGQFKVIDIVG